MRNTMNMKENNITTITTQVSLSFDLIKLTCARCQNKFTKIDDKYKNFVFKLGTDGNSAIWIADIRHRKLKDCLEKAEVASKEESEESSLSIWDLRNKIQDLISLTTKRKAEADNLLSYFFRKLEGLKEL